MVKIRLRRVGRKNAPFYRILVADSQSPRDGKFIEIIGQYAPRKGEGSLQVNEARANQWLDLGAKLVIYHGSVLLRRGAVGSWQPFARKWCDGHIDHADADMVGRRQGNVV